MQSKRKLLGIVCILAVIILCSVNTTYCWQNLDQTALNITAGEPNTEEKPDEPEKPEEPDEPDKPDEEPKAPEESQKPPEIPKEPQSSGTQNSQDITGEADTGDNSPFLFYMVLMLLSFILMIVLGVSLVVLTINTIEKRRT